MVDSSKTISVVGAGSWGTAISALLAGKGQKVILWARDIELTKEINKTHYNPRYISNIKLPSDLKVTSDLEETVTESEYLILAVPSHAFRNICMMIKDYLNAPKIFISLTKGIELVTGKRMSEIITDVLGHKAFPAVLSGPNHAEEVSMKIPSATVISCNSASMMKSLQEIFITDYFRVYTNSDMVGVELGGASKNVIAIAAGISDGLGYGDNTKASLMTRGLVEMSRLGITLGADPLTFAGLSGVGDLIATCTSRHSRNRQVGELLAKGYSIEEINKRTTMVAEGVKTAKAVIELASKFNVSLPISQNVAEVIYEGKDPKKCVIDLMTRGRTEEKNIF